MRLHARNEGEGVHVASHKTYSDGLQLQVWRSPSALWILSDDQITLHGVFSRAANPNLCHPKPMHKYERTRRKLPHPVSATPVSTRKHSPRVAVLVISQPGAAFASKDPLGCKTLGRLVGDGAHARVATLTAFSFRTTQTTHGASTRAFFILSKQRKIASIHAGVSLTTQNLI